MLTRKAEDYLEAILNITNDKGYVRIKDIANTLNIKPPSVIEMVKKLDNKDFVEYRKYDGIKLTQKGRDIALVIKDRHENIKAFLQIILVPEKIADQDACVMEHELHSITTKQIKNLVNFVKTSPGSSQWLWQFEKFCIDGTHVYENKNIK
jgi:DtxR family Mn-dependent transcriptional regulator